MKLPVHQHPPTPTTVYVNVTDGGPDLLYPRDWRTRSRSGHRAQAGAGGWHPLLLTARLETHTVEYLGDAPTEYARIELRTRSPSTGRFATSACRPSHADLSKSSKSVRFENGQVRIVHVTCAAGQSALSRSMPQTPAVVVTLSGPRRGEIVWSPTPARGPLEQIRIELKSKPVKASHRTEDRADPRHLSTTSTIKQPDPAKRHDGERRKPWSGVALKIGGEPALPVIAKNARVTGAEQRSFARKQESTAGV